MKLKVSYHITKVTIGAIEVNGEYKRKYYSESRFKHEEIDMDEICRILASKYKNENFDADEIVSVTCDID